MPRPAPKTNFFKFFFHTIILLILVNKMTPCALLKNSFQKLKQIRSEKSSLFKFVRNICIFCKQMRYLLEIYVYLHANMYICSKYTYICMQKRIFACKYVLIHKKQRRSQMSSLLWMRWEKPLLSLTNERKRNTGTQLKLILVFNRWFPYFIWPLASWRFQSQKYDAP